MKIQNAFTLDIGKTKFTSNYTITRICHIYMQKLYTLNELVSFKPTNLMRGVLFSWLNNMRELQKYIIGYQQHLTGIIWY